MFFFIIWRFLCLLSADKKYNLLLPWDLWESYEWKLQTWKEKEADHMWRIQVHLLRVTEWNLPFVLDGSNWWTQLSPIILYMLLILIDFELRKPLHILQFFAIKSFPSTFSPSSLMQIRIFNQKIFYFNNFHLHHNSYISSCNSTLFQGVQIGEHSYFYVISRKKWRFLELKESLELCQKYLVLIFWDFEQKTFI